MRRCLILLAALTTWTACGDVRSTSEVHERSEHGLFFQVSVTGFQEYGVGGGGAAHGLGLLYPTFEGSGARFELCVRSRPCIEFARIPLERAPSRAGTVEMAASVQTRVSENGQHIAVAHDGHWQLFHLLAAGTPFGIPGEHADPDSLETLADANTLLAQAFEGDGRVSEMMWAASEANVDDEVVLRGLFERWPADSRAFRVLTPTLRESEVFRALAEERARARVTTWRTDGVAGQDLQRAMAWLGRTDEGRAWLSSTLNEALATTSAPLSVTLSQYLSSETRHEGGDARAALRGAARRFLDREYASVDAFHTLRGSDQQTVAATNVTGLADRRRTAGGRHPEYDVCREKPTSLRWPS